MVRLWEDVLQWEKNMTHLEKQMMEDWENWEPAVSVRAWVGVRARVCHCVTGSDRKIYTEGERERERQRERERERE